MDNQKLYQDEIYGAKVLTPLAAAIIDTPEFQRLSGLRQLGFANICYRGAQHTRFAHSVGTYFISRTIMRRLVQNHERFGLDHPGSLLSEKFRIVPPRAYPAEVMTEIEMGKDDLVVSYASLWRGLVDVVSIAALIHDIGHVPFGHTLEDEFPGILERHDRLAGPRLFEMLFNDESELAKVLVGRSEPWIGTIPNEELRRLIYVILSWKDKVDPPAGFENVLDKSIKDGNAEPDTKKRLRDLKKWYKAMREDGMFHPFMSDVIGNTICADLLDYLPRDRQNLGMEFRTHSRLQRYFTIRNGGLYEDEGYRVSIMVCRKGRGGQRPDVATAVLDVMRERYEMAERVYYHHKKAAASSMLAKLTELSTDHESPVDEKNSIYPAPWTLDEEAAEPRPNMVHFSDSSLLEYLHDVSVEPNRRALQKALYLGLRYRRKSLYRTLLVVDMDLVRMSAHSVGFFARDLRGSEEMPSNAGRQKRETELAEAAGVEDGKILVYCPSPDMQSKEVDVRLEIMPERILPLRLQKESFTYQADVRVLEDYYQELWRMYVFVSSDVFEDASKCRKVVDRFCEIYDINKNLAYRKVRDHDFEIEFDVTVKEALDPLVSLFSQKEDSRLGFTDTPTEIVARLLAGAAEDLPYLELVRDGEDRIQRAYALFDISILESLLDEPERQFEPSQEEVMQDHILNLKEGHVSGLLIARNRGPQNPHGSFEEYQKELVDFATVEKNS